LTENRKILMRDGGSHNRTSQRESYTDPNMEGSGTDEAKEVTDAFAFQGNFPEGWRDHESFDLVAAFGQAAVSQKRMKWTWANPTSGRMPNMPLSELKYALREKIHQRVVAGRGTLRKSFNIFALGGRYITFDKFCNALQMMGMGAVFTQRHVLDLFESIDEDHDGLIQMVEFVRAFLEDDSEPMVDRRRRAIQV